MALTITLYTSTADPKTVDKSSGLTQIGSTTITATPTGDIDILAPVVLLNYNSTYLPANYAYISEFGRYYYVNDKTVKPGESMTLTMSVDPLMSFKSDILGCKACITRSESIGGPTEVNDDKLPIDPNKKEILSQVADFDWLNYAGTDAKKWRSVFVSIQNNPALSP